MCCVCGSVGIHTKAHMCWLLCLSLLVEIRRHLGGTGSTMWVNILDDAGVWHRVQSTENRETKRQCAVFRGWIFMAAELYFRQLVYTCPKLLTT